MLPSFACSHPFNKACLTNKSKNQNFLPFTWNPLWKHLDQHYEKFASCSLHLWWSSDMENFPFLLKQSSSVGITAESEQIRCLMWIWHVVHPDSVCLIKTIAAHIQSLLGPDWRVWKGLSQFPPSHIHHLCSEPSWLENTEALQSLLSTGHMCCNREIGQSHHLVVWSSLCSQRHFYDRVFKYVKKKGEWALEMLQLPLIGLCLFASTRVLWSQWVLEAEKDVPGLAVVKWLQHISQDKKLFKGTKGNLTPLEFNALENLASHSIFCLTGKIRLEFLLYKISLTN